MTQRVIATFYVEGSLEFQQHYYEEHLKPAMEALKMQSIGGMRRATVLDGTLYTFGFDRDRNIMVGDRTFMQEEGEADVEQHS